MLVSFILLSWYKKVFLKKCLSSFYKEQYGNNFEPRITTYDPCYSQKFGYLERDINKYQDAEFLEVVRKYNLYRDK